jgi:predicted DNA-binding protein (MmcQ/YjbR family)
MLDLERTEWFVLKCQPDYAIELRDRHPEITGAWHMNKKHWNQLCLEGYLTDDLVKNLIRHSYNEVVKKIPRRTREELHITLIP